MGREEQGRDGDKEQAGGYKWLCKKKIREE